MEKNYFRLAIRNLLKYRLITGINLFGLTVGVTCCLLITAYIIQELSYDRYNKNAARIYRVTRSFNNADGVVSLTLATVSPPFGYYLPADFPEIEKQTRLLEAGPVAIRYQEKLINEPDPFFADENLFRVFTVNVHKGDPVTALANPYSVMMTPQTARKYFGDEDPMNKTVRFRNLVNLKVTGIFEPFPVAAHVHPAMLVSFSSLADTLLYGAEQLRTNWGNNSLFTYLLLPPHYDPEKMVARFPAFLNNHMAGQYGGKKPSDFTKLGLQPLTRIHLYSHTDYEAEVNSDAKRVYIFSAIAFFILLIAGINYMNLSTARSALRAREIGIRKVLGAGRRELIFQFLSEAILLSAVAIVLGLILLYAAMPWLNRLADQHLTLSLLWKWPVLLSILLAPVLIGGLAGIYPAIFMSRFSPIKTLKGLFSPGRGTVSLRKGLVVFQFAVSIVLIITTAVVFRQLHYMQDKALGYDREQVVVMNLSSQVSDNYEAFRHDLLSNPSVKALTRSSRLPGGRLLDNSGASSLSGDSLVPVKTDIKYLAVDRDFLPAYGIQLAAGRNFSRDFGTDSSNFILNETAVRALNWPSAAAAVGKDFRYGLVRGHIIGVTKDFHFESMHQPIVPMILVQPAGNRDYNYLQVKIDGHNVRNALAHIERTWKKYSPEAPWQGNFLAENFDALYRSEQKQGGIFTAFSGIAILIACLGLLGLSAFTISQRIKEIGIRKVLGASTGSIVELLSRDFLLLVALAALIAFPVAWIAMHHWLQDFAYHTGLPWWLFLLAGAVAAIVALLTISIQAVRAACANPVKSLRTE